jgi:hypothetical protein
MVRSFCRHRSKPIVLMAAAFAVAWIIQDCRWVRRTMTAVQREGVISNGTGGGRGGAPLEMTARSTTGKDEMVTDNNHNERRQQNTLEHLQALAQSFPAARFMYERYRAYDAAGDGERWKYRGLGYLYLTHGLVLEATYDPRTKVIVIRNIAQSAAAAAPPTTTTVDCHLFTLWVRMAGPELFAGKANATNDDDGSSSAESSSCHWEFPVPHLQITGQYQIDVKLLVYNGRAPIRFLQPSSQPGLTPSQCRVQAGNDTSPLQQQQQQQQQQYQHEGIRGFKLYDPVASCCEICTRLPHCHYWATPPVDFDASYTNNGCEFWFDDPTYVIPPSKHLGRNSTTATTDLLRRQRQRSRRHQHRRRNRRQLGDVPTAHGPPHNGTFAYFMGCGWSLWFSLDYPCLSGDLDDRVYVVEPTVRYNSSDNHAVDDKTKMNDVNPNVLPLCSKADERGSSGRWVRGKSIAVADCPLYRHHATVSSSFDIVEFTPDQPHCWHRDNFAIIGNTCLEMNCQFIPKTSLWRSTVHEETDWFGVWRPYRCDYLEFTKDQLQSCITENRISLMDVYGQSIAAFLKQYLHQRLDGIVMYRPTAEQAGASIVLTTLGALHWAGGSDDDLASAAQKEMETLRQKYGNEAMVYLVPGFFLSSERAMQRHVDRMQLVNTLVLEPLLSNETTMTVTLLEAFDLSAAFTYDTATQNDGMHIIGPTMKMIITKLFHHMCADTTTGSRVGGSY